MKRLLGLLAVVIMAGGKKYAVIELDEDTLSSLGGLSKLISGPQKMEIVYKAKRTTTRKPMATRKIEAALQSGKLTDADLATFKKFGMSDAQIAALVAKKE